MTLKHWVQKNLEKPFCEIELVRTQAWCKK